MKIETPVEFINRLADEMRESGAIAIEGAVYTESQFPDGFWRKLAKEVNYLAHTEMNHLQELSWSGQVDHMSGAFDPNDRHEMGG